jgi:hypothetical protein
MVAAMSLRWLLTAVFAAAALGALPVRKQPGSPQLATVGQGRAVTTWREARASGRFWSRRRHPGSDLNAPNSGESKADRVSDGFHTLMCAALIGTTLGGYSLIRAGNLDAAVTLARGCPLLPHGTIEICELASHDDRFDNWLDTIGDLS